MNLKELRARRKDAQLRGNKILNKATAESRDLTDDEEKMLDELKKEVEKYDKQIERVEAFVIKDKPKQEENSRRDEDNDDDKEDDDDEDEKPPKEKPEQNSQRNFRSFGEQALAVYRAAQPGGRIDTRLSTRAASGMNATDPTDGGFLVQTDFVKELMKLTHETGLLQNKCHKIPLSTNANSIRINAIDEISRVNGSRWGGLQTFWQDEAEKMIESKPKFRQIELSLKKLTGICKVTDELLQDAAALETVLKNGFAEEFGFKMDEAILKGTGGGQPLGILNSGSLVKVEPEAGQTEKITVQNLITMWSRIWSRSRTKSVWLVNPEIEPLLYTLTVGDKPIYIPAGSMANEPYGKLLGRPVIALEQCSALGEIGDIILADMGQYVTIEKGGIRAESSIHVRFAYDESMFRFIYRTDGQPLWHQPLKPYNKSGALVSPFIALAKRNK